MASKVRANTGDFDNLTVGGDAPVPETRDLAAGDGLTGGGDLSADRTFAVSVDDATIEIDSDALQVKDGGITPAKLSFDPATQAELDAVEAAIPALATGDVSGPNPYAAGGFVVDLTATFSSVEFFALAVKKGSRGNLPVADYEYDLDEPDPGKVTVKVVKSRYDKATAGDTSAQNAPTGVTIQGASGATVANESAHTHAPGTLAVDIDHDHANATSTAAQSAPINPTAGVGGTGADDATHTHDVNLPALGVTSKSVTGTSAAGAAHNHVDNNLYQHGHNMTQTATDSAVAELGAIDLSATSWRYMATGVAA